MGTPDTAAMGSNVTKNFYNLMCLREYDPLINRPQNAQQVKSFQLPSVLSSRKEMSHPLRAERNFISIEGQLEFQSTHL